MVSDDQTIFKYNTHPMSLFCSQEAYKPVSSTYAWELVGACSGTIAPLTATPTTTAVELA
jgi:hypothetical protein